MPKPFFGTVVTGQVLKEDYTIDWNSEANAKLYHRDLVIKKGIELTPAVNHDKWRHSISKVEIVNQTNAKNVKDSIIRGAVGGMALGGVGALAGVMSAKSNSTFNVMITYHNNQLDLIECDINLYTKLSQQANENSTLGITEHEEVYFSEEEKKKNDEEWQKENEGNWIFGCGCLVAILGVIGFLIWIVFIWEG